MARKTYHDVFKIAAAKLVRRQGDTVKKAAIRFVHENNCIINVNVCVS